MSRIIQPSKTGDLVSIPGDLIWRIQIKFELSVFVSSSFTNKTNRLPYVCQDVHTTHVTTKWKISKAMVN
jgi:hypothetical protein